MVRLNILVGKTKSPNEGICPGVTTWLDNQHISGNFISCILCVYTYKYIIYINNYISIYDSWSHSKALQWKNVRFPGVPALPHGWMHPKDWPLMDQKCVLLGNTKGPACCMISYHLLLVEVGEASIHKPSTGKRTSKLLPSSTHVLMFYQLVHGLPSQSSLGSPLAGVLISRSRREAMVVEAGDQAISQGQSN